jgi:hypothetical protein
VKTDDYKQRARDSATLGQKNRKNIFLSEKRKQELACADAALPFYARENGGSREEMILRLCL